MGCTDVFAGDDDITKIGHVDGDINAACRIMPVSSPTSSRAAAMRSRHAGARYHYSCAAASQTCRVPPLHAGFGSASVLWCRQQSVDFRTAEKAGVDKIHFCQRLQRLLVGIKPV